MGILDPHQEHDLRARYIAQEQESPPPAIQGLRMSAESSGVASPSLVCACLSEQLQQEVLKRYERGGVSLYAIVEYGAKVGETSYITGNGEVTPAALLAGVSTMDWLRRRAPK